MSRACLLLVIVASVGCVHFDQTHHFKEWNPTTGEVANYLRVTISGTAKFSKARYVSGNYDERAIDLFFNEIESTAGNEADIRPIFTDDMVSPGTGNKITPLESTDGTKLMIFSTNAKAVADTIGQFSENQVAADAITNLLNQRDVAAARGEQQRLCETVSPRATALKAELTEIVNGLPSGDTPDAVVTEEQSLRLLGRVARELGRNGAFATFAEADAWFRAYRQGRSR